MEKTQMHLKKNEDIGVSYYDVDFLETLVYEWVRRPIHSKNFRLTNSVLKSAAHRFKAMLNLKSFYANDEWLQKFRMTYLKDMETPQPSDIKNKCSNSKNIYWNIFNELLPKWQALDPKFNQPTSTIEIDANSMEFFDIEEELPVCTIFGRKTVQNVANIISSNKKSDDDKFEPMIVCTDPKNPDLNLMDKSTKEHTFFNSTNKPEVEKIKDLINGKLIDTDSNTSSQNEYIDQYLKEIVRVPDNDRITYIGSSEKSSLKPTTEIAKYESPIFKPISLSKLRIKKIKPQNEQNLKQPSDPSSEVIDTESYKQPLAKPNRKRKIKQNLSELPKTINLETKTVDQTPTMKPLTLDSAPLPAKSPKTLQAEDLNQIPAVIQQAAFQPNITTSSLLGETIPDTQSSLVAPGRIMYTFQMSAPNQNQLTMPYVSPMTTNFQTNQFGQTTSLTPMVLHFHSPLTLQTTEILPGSEMMSSAVMNITQTPSQASFIPSIDLTQQTTSPNFANLIQNQFMPSTTTFVQQSVSTNQTPTIVTTPTISTSSMQQIPVLETIPSNSTLTTTPTVHVSNLIPTKIKSTKTKTKPSKATVSSKSRTITSKITSLTSTTATACLPNLASSKIKPTTTTLLQPTVPTQPPTIKPSTSNSSLITPTSPTITSTPLTLNSIQQMPISIKNSISNTKATTSMQVTITKKSGLTTNPKKATRFAQRAPLQTHEEVIKCIKLMEDFAMMNENFRLIGFLERLEQEVYVNKTK